MHEHGVANLQYTHAYRACMCIRHGGTGGSPTQAVECKDSLDVAIASPTVWVAACDLVAAETRQARIAQYGDQITLGTPRTDCEASKLGSGFRKLTKDRTQQRLTHRNVIVCMCVYRVRAALAFQLRVVALAGHRRYACVLAAPWRELTMPWGRCPESNTSVCFALWLESVVPRERDRCCA